MVRFPRHFSELILPLDLLEALTLSIYLLSMVLSLSKMINFREIKSYLSVMMLSKWIFDNIGCEVYSHIPKEFWNKLEAKSQKCIFLGYGES